MNQPSFAARLAARPPITLLLLLFYAAILYGWYQGFYVSLSWYQGTIPWWVAVAAVAAVFRTLGAVQRVRRYKAWLAEWHAMGAEDEAPHLPKRRRGWVVVLAAALVVVTIPAYLPQIQNLANGFAVPLVWVYGLWSAAGLYLVFKLVFKPTRAVHRRLRMRATGKAEAAPVAWLVDRAASSPSRDEMVRNLPEYSARLIATDTAATH